MKKYSFIFSFFLLFAVNSDLLARTITGQQIFAGYGVTGLTAENNAVLSINPANFSIIDSSSFDFRFFPNAFGLSELNSGQLFFGSPVNDDFSVGASISGLSSEPYSEFIASTGFAYLVTSDFVIGMSSDFSKQRFKGFDDTDAFFLNLGARLALNDEFTFAMSIQNINGFRAQIAEFSPNRRASFGLAFAKEHLPALELSGGINSVGNIFWNLSSRFVLDDTFVFGIAYSTDSPSFSGFINTYLGYSSSLGLSLSHNAFLGFSQSVYLNFGL